MYQKGDMTVKEELLRRVEALSPQFYPISDYIFDHPELGYQEHEACRVLTRLLSQSGFQVETGVGGIPTAFRTSRPIWFGW